MAYEWFTDSKNVLELGEFMVESDQMTTVKELLEYFRHPERYTKVWRLYQQEIHGRTSGNHKSNPDMRIPIPVMLALTEKRTY